jgi:FkbM family methyltransferase
MGVFVNRIMYKSRYRIRKYIKEIPKTLIPIVTHPQNKNHRVSALLRFIRWQFVGIGANKEDEIFFTADENTTNRVVADGEKSRSVVRVKVLPLDRILCEQSPFIIKIDVEGFETSVIKEAYKTFQKKSLHSVNTLFIRNLEASKEKITKSKKVTGGKVQI